MEQNNRNYGIGMSVFGSIFFIFGFATTFIITMSAPVKAIFGLTEFEAQLLSSAFFITYPVMSIPTGRLINKIGYKWTVILGLILMGIGSITFVPAAKDQIQSLFYVATFILATGVVFLQVAANPYVTALGPDSSASSRLNLTQALNSIATMVAPWLISIAIFKGLDLPAMATEAQKRDYGLAVADRIPVPFIIMALIVIAVAIVLFTIKLPKITSEEEDKSKAGNSVWKHPHVVLGAIGIFAYVGAEVGNAGLIVNYLKSNIVFNGELMSATMASTYAAIYWGGAMVGRFFGSFMFSEMPQKKKITYALPVLVLAFVSGSFVTDWSWSIGGVFTGVALVNFIIMQIGRGKAARTLAIFALMAALLDITTTFSTGSVALWTVISIGLFNSIMFPNIFALAVKDLEKAELSGASGLINALILGGAVIPPLMGTVADKAGYTWAFLVPAVCYLYIFYYAVKGNFIRK